MTPKDKNDFEERLLAELRQVAAERPVPEPAPARSAWRPRTLALGGGGIAVAAAGIAILAGSGGGTSNAYAVDRNLDGEVTVKIKSLKDAEGLEAKLREAGVPAVVSYDPPISLECAAKLQQARPAGDEAEGLESRKAPTTAEAVPDTTVRPAAPATPVPEGPGVPAEATVPARTIPVSDEATFTVDPREIREGDKLYVTKPTRADAPGVAAAIAAPSEVPDC